MKTKSLLFTTFIVITALVGLASTQFAEAAKTDVEPRFGFEWTIAPIGEHGQYICDVAVKDLNTGEVLAAPRFSMMKGDQGRIRQGGPVDPGNDMQPVDGQPLSGTLIEAEVLVEDIEGKTEVTYTGTIKRGDVLLASDAASVILP